MTLMRNSRLNCTIEAYETVIVVVHVVCFHLFEFSDPDELYILTLMEEKDLVTPGPT